MRNDRMLVWLKLRSPPGRLRRFQVGVMPLLYETLMAGTFLAAALPDAIVGSPDPDTVDILSVRCSQVLHQVCM